MGLGYDRAAALSPAEGIFVCSFKPPRSEERVQGTEFLAGVWGLQPCARCAGFSMAEIGNRKERLRDYASFPDRSPKRSSRNPKSRSDKEARIRERSVT